MVTCWDRVVDLNTVTEIARPRQRAELPACRDGDAWLAGGTWLFSEPQNRVTRLIDITDLAWPAVEITEQSLRIAATCKVAQLDSMAFPASWTAAPLFNQCCRAFLASFKVWNMATVGGNLCMALPAGPMISLTAALDGSCTIWTPSGGERHVSVVEFIQKPERNALMRGELLRHIDLPIAALQQRTAFRQISLSPLGRSAALLIGTRAPDTGVFTLTVTASTPRPLQLSFASVPSRDALQQEIERKITTYHNDVHGSPDWRRHMTLLLAEEIRNELNE
jgi:CO/xanthine dehydrogenase FAD-binding subunit